MFLYFYIPSHIKINVRSYVVHDIHKLCYLWCRIRMLRLEGGVVRATASIVFSDIL